MSGYPKSRMCATCSGGSNPECICPSCAMKKLNKANEKLAAATNRVGEVEKALAAINDIRNSIIGHQSVNWSAHIYPLVAALESVGIKGEGYDVAKEKAETLHDHITTLLTKGRLLKRECEAWRLWCSLDGRKDMNDVLQARTATDNANAREGWGE